MITKFDVVIYHSPCSDGFGGAYVAWLHNRDSLFIGLDPRDGFPRNKMSFLDNKRVIVIDIAFSTDVMIEMFNRSDFLIVLDHHETNKNVLQKLSFTKFDMNKSGCVLAWEYFYPELKTPLFLEYICLRDLWKHKDNEDALYFTTEFYSSAKFEFEDYNRFLDNPSLIEETISKGKERHETFMETVKQISETASDGIFETYPAKILNVGYPYVSDVGDYLSTKNPECAILFWKKSNDEYIYSLRSHSESGPNVAEIAKKFGGGGHIHAAGFKWEFQLLVL